MSGHPRSSPTCSFSPWDGGFGLQAHQPAAGALERHRVVWSVRRPITEDWHRWSAQECGARGVLQAVRLQSLWDGYGAIWRVELEYGSRSSAVLKLIAPPPDRSGSLAHERKQRSYRVELGFYRRASRLGRPEARVAELLASREDQGELWLLLEDLEASGYRPVRALQRRHLEGALRWLAFFHAGHLERNDPELWEQGSYWHLSTRPQEWAAMPDGPLKLRAGAIDQQLRDCPFPTLLHGDAKPANFCWDDQGRAAAVDFQYTGPGCGLRDVAYFLDCALGEAGCGEWAASYLDLYFGYLHQALQLDGRGDLAGPIEEAWRPLYPVVWADFCRFWLGWRQGATLGPYSRALVERALQKLTPEAEKG